MNQLDRLDWADQLAEAGDDETLVSLRLTLNGRQWRKVRAALETDDDE